MTPTARKLVRHILIAIALLLLITALGIYFNLGPVVHSSDPAARIAASTHHPERRA